MYDQAVVMIFDALEKLAGDDALVRRYSPTGAKSAVLFADMLRIEMPTWWTVEQDCVVCLP